MLERLAAAQQVHVADMGVAFVLGAARENANVANYRSGAAVSVVGS